MPCTACEQPTQPCSEYTEPAADRRRQWSSIPASVRSVQVWTGSCGFRCQQVLSRTRAVDHAVQIKPNDCLVCALNRLHGGAYGFVRLATAGGPRAGDARAAQPSQRHDDHCFIYIWFLKATPVAADLHSWSDQNMWCFECVMAIEQCCRDEYCLEHVVRCLQHELLF